MPVFKFPLKRNLDVHLENFFNSITVRNKYGAMAATATVIFASVYIGWAYAKRSCKKQKKKVHGVFTRSMSVGVLHGGKLALERVIDYHRARTDEASLKAAENELKELLIEEHPDFVKLQSTVAMLEMSGKEAVAVGILEKQLQRARKDGKSHVAYEIEMLLVEMHIYQGEFKKALDCECLSHEEISDARRPLYKAIIYIMLGRPREEVLICWKKFIDFRIRFQSPSSDQSHLNKAVTNFEEFEKAVKLLTNDIHEAHGKQIKP
ncbi:hypothetical protein POTOM_015288 [Populus tomentosa]|uniref:Tetratricopeptide repeat (TPR)-like superfamily protein n=1 Tax=Populus tomentosa TaxID=118781 RepID=A0A8X8D5U9_POPTO|nr:hypothetical protein POTOM_015288 [Populus tomentosa]